MIRMIRAQLIEGQYAGVSSWDALIFYKVIFYKEETPMAEKIVWEDGADVTAEDIAAALKPLVDEYFLGTCEQQGAALCYTLPDGRKFRIAAGEIG